MWLERGEHVCLVGANGSGKTTLLETLVGEREATGRSCAAGTTPRSATSPSTQEIAGDGNATLLSHAQRATGLSGRRRGRCSAASCSAATTSPSVSRRLRRRGPAAGAGAADASDANVLVLDEPTNHLDLESREALEDALTGFAGSLLLVSHDRALLEAVGSRTLVIEGEALTSHPGGWAEYRSAVEQERAASAAGAREPKRGRPPRPAGASKNRKADLARLEREVEKAEADFRRLEDELADPSHWSDPRRSARATARHDAARVKLDELIARWEAAAERVEG